MLGDVVSLGYRTNRWRKVDLFLYSCKKENIAVFGLLGNHDVMGRKNKGERNFNKRFPENIRTGYISITDSVAVILLNSNFSKLSAAEKRKQLNWYKLMLKTLDKNFAVKAIIVTCHHAPYTNSIIVGSSNVVQQSFVPPFMDASKAQLFITGHAHAFEHFNIKGKHFLVIGGGGGLHQPLNNSTKSILDLAADYKPFFHYLSIQLLTNQFQITSHYLKEDFSAILNGYNFVINF